MALEVNPLTCSAQIKYHMGINHEGKELVLTRSFTGFKTDMSDEDVYDVVTTVIDLQEPTVIQVHRIDRKEFMEG
ncbi:MAG: DUF1659 domain-containing protein [Clostridiales bacterium]|jgi:hypothetical protein|nr:DUF1659 domain-containing protein [Clostridiales bacterium]